MCPKWSARRSTSLFGRGVQSWTNNTFSCAKHAKNAEFANGPRLLNDVALNQTQLVHGIVNSTAACLICKGAHQAMRNARFAVCSVLCLLTSLRALPCRLCATHALLCHAQCALCCVFCCVLADKLACSALQTMRNARFAVWSGLLYGLVSLNADLGNHFPPKLLAAADLAVEHLSESPQQWVFSPGLGAKSISQVEGAL
eukprot:1162010-Pelagomonas_calceolata.AAC.4